MTTAKNKGKARVKQLTAVQMGALYRKGSDPGTASDEYIEEVVRRTNAPRRKARNPELAILLHILRAADWQGAKAAIEGARLLAVPTGAGAPFGLVDRGATFFAKLTARDVDDLLPAWRERRTRSGKPKGQSLDARLACLVKKCGGVPVDTDTVRKTREAAILP